MWSDETSNRKGKTIATFVEKGNTSFLNTGEPTHFHVQNGPYSSIDLTICSSNCYLEDFKWEETEERHTSDHFPIIININDCIPAPRSPRWCLEKADWVHFEKLTVLDCKNVDDYPSVEDAVNLIHHIILRAASFAIPCTTGKFHRKPVPWWNTACAIAHKAMRAAYTRYK
ncbi:uncharacterized protein LOC143026094 [Oratosquilla oratoria]|uniref:uncharacterized protein LOC143026094 n=1 Tax=Oratosquilla oratoria TaxID=337810 RepID=UPI003F764B0A